MFLSYQTSTSWKDPQSSFSVGSVLKMNMDCFGKGFIRTTCSGKRWWFTGQRDILASVSGAGSDAALATLFTVVFNLSFHQNRADFLGSSHSCCGFGRQLRPAGVHFIYTLFTMVRFILKDFYVTVEAGSSEASKIEFRFRLSFATARKKLSPF